MYNILTMRRADSKKPQVLFICLGNSCRSIMAEALARSLLGDRLAPVSAGLRPLGFITPETLQVLTEIGAPINGLRSKGLEDTDLAACRLSVNLTHHSLPPQVTARMPGRLLQRPMPDPYGGSLEDYRRSRDAIQRLLLEGLATWLLP